VSTTSELEAIIGAVQARMLTLSGITHATNYEPVHLKGVEIPTSLKVNSLIDYWYVECLNTGEAWRTNEEVLLTHELALKGYREVGDPSVTAPAMRALTSALGDLFRQHYRLDEPVNFELLGPLQTPVRGQLLVLAETWTVHHSECRLIATERVVLPSL